MFRKMLTTTALVALGQAAYAEPITVEEVVTALESEGFTVREVKSGMTRIKVEAIGSNGEKLEVVYNKENGDLLKREIEFGNGGGDGTGMGNGTGMGAGAGGYDDDDDDDDDYDDDHDDDRDDDDDDRDDDHDDDHGDDDDDDRDDDHDDDDDDDDDDDHDDDD